MPGKKSEKTVTQKLEEIRPKFLRSVKRLCDDLAKLQGLDPKSCAKACDYVNRKITAAISGGTEENPFK